MSIQDQVPKTRSAAPTRKATVAPNGAPARRTDSLRGPVLAVLRVMMGLTFLWAFLDKTFGLGYATPAAKAWVDGGSPTKGFLGNVQVGPMQSTLQSWAGSGWADWLFMIGLLGIGLALLLGVGMRRGRHVRARSCSRSCGSPSGRRHRSTPPVRRRRRRTR